ncbi:MAG: hypothetical protein NWF10_06025 [Candidatus Bathyarchaeota archaeon]|jgi:hypothetical protein|nr:hypothetical protein [Candidatus Bathyarchaeota archaeon]
MEQLGLKEKRICSILLIGLISVFVFAGTVMTVGASPKAEFFI